MTESFLETHHPFFLSSLFQPAQILQNLLKSGGGGSGLALSPQQLLAATANLAGQNGDAPPAFDSETFQRILSSMKVPPIALPGAPGAPAFNPDLLWRLPPSFLAAQQPPPSPLEAGLRSHLPGGLGHDPKCWNRDDVAVFLRFCEKEFDLDTIDMDKFQMNGE